MKNIEIIKLILKEKPDEDVYRLFNNDDSYNLIYLCILNKKYLNDEVLNQILNSKLIYNNLPYLLSNFPNFIDKIPKDLLNNLKNDDWVMIISHQPQLLDYCKIINELDVYDLHIILKNQPELLDKIKKNYITKNKNTLFDFILNSKEDLNIDFNNIFISELNENINKINVFNLLNIFKYNPKLIKFFPISDEVKKSFYLYPNEVIELVSKQISFKYLLPSINKISDKDLTKLISYQPQLIKELNIDLKKFNVDDWSIILAKQPQLIDRCDKLKKLNQYNWVDILRKQPKLIKYCDKIDEFDSYSWYLVLYKYPELIKYCNNLDTIGVISWNMILQSQPQLSDNCNKFDRIKGDDLYDLLEKQPELINKCKNTKTINRNKRIMLLKKHPILVDKIELRNINKKHIEIIYNSREYHLKFMKSYIKYNKDSKVLTDMINLYPDLKKLYTKNDLWKYVDFSKLINNLEYSILK